MVIYMYECNASMKRQLKIKTLFPHILATIPKNYIYK